MPTIALQDTFLEEECFTETHPVTYVPKASFRNLFSYRKGKDCLFILESKSGKNKSLTKHKLVSRAGSRPICPCQHADHSRLI